MSIIKFDIQTSPLIADDIRALEKEVPRRMYRKVVRDVIPPLEREMDRRLRKTPPPRDRSRRFVWSLDKQKDDRARRWFHANYPDGYTRTGEMVKAWETSIDFENGTTIIRIYNPSKGASYVFGSDEFGQVPGHITTGWPSAPDEVLEVGIKLERDLSDAWGEVLNEYL